MQTDVDALYDGMISSSIMAHAERRADDSTDYFKSARVRDPLDPTTGTGRNGAVQDGDLRELPRPSCNERRRESDLRMLP